MCLHMAEKDGFGPAQKLSIFSRKANFERGLFLMLVNQLLTPSLRKFSFKKSVLIYTKYFYRGLLDLGQQLPL